MAASVQDIENALVVKLSETFPDLAVEPFPERPAEYELLHPLGAVLVQYDGSSFSGNQVTGAVVQARTLRFNLVYMVRNLRDSSGCFAIMERGAGAVCGLKIPGTLTAGIIVSETFSAENDGVWMYVQTYEFATRNVVANHT